MSGLVNMAHAGEPPEGKAQVQLPVVGPGEKAVVTFQGPQDGSATRHWAPEPPTDYEVRRDALMAASQYAASGGWGGAQNVIEKIAKPFEEYLLEVRNQ